MLEKMKKGDGSASQVSAPASMAIKIIGGIVLIAVILFGAYSFGFFGSRGGGNGTNTSTVLYNNTPSIHTSTPTTISTHGLPTFNLTGWKVTTSHDGYSSLYDSVAVIAFNYTTTAPVEVYLYDNITRHANGTYSWPESDHIYLNKTSGKANLSMTDAVTNASPPPGNYLMVAYSVDSYGNLGTAVWNKTFTFTGPHIVILNASVTWNRTGTSGVYWYNPVNVIAKIENTGDLPAYGYFLRAWVNKVGIFFYSGEPYGWIQIGGPWTVHISTVPGTFNDTIATYSLHVKFVHDESNVSYSGGDMPKTLAAQWNGYTRT